jgi:hypothetical protein
MRALVSLLISTLLLTACDTMPSSHYQLEQNANQFVGDNIQSVIKQWGTPNQALHTAEGSSYYIYTTKTDTYAATINNNYDNTIVGPRGHAIGTSVPENIPSSSTGQLLCTTTFKTNSATGKILWVKHQGSSCLGTWVNTTDK